MTRYLAQAVSYVFHPLFLFYYLILMVYWVNPFAFRVTEHKDKVVFMVMALVILVILPIIATLMMRGLGLIKSIHTEDKTERIGPMIATIICYVWFYVNIYQNPTLPEQLSIIGLGGAISLCLAFFINNFSKISLHATGAGAFLTGMVILLLSYAAPRLIIDFGGLGIYTIAPLMVLMISVLIAGMVGTSRLLLGAHRPVDIYGGYLVGFMSMIIAYRIVLL